MIFRIPQRNYCCKKLDIESSDLHVLFSFPCFVLQQQVYAIFLVLFTLDFKQTINLKTKVMRTEFSSIVGQTVWWVKMKKSS